ncbi:MAG TPA: aldo/keto reductase, partial [Methanoregula sp.]|nr:aldo/keto reductase [Methanoregula sp.]
LSGNNADPVLQYHAKIFHILLPLFTLINRRNGFRMHRPAGDPVPTRNLGRTGERVSVIGLGGYHLGTPDLPEAESIRIIRTAIDSGITFLDNCWDYNDGLSEVRMGRALRGGYRDRAFLMTKVDGRDRQSAADQIGESLKRLRTDRIDLLQFHEIIHEDDPERIFAEGGALEAFLEARDDGKIRFIGFTGHKSPSVHLKMLTTAARHHFRFDTVQMPLNVMDAHFESFERQVLPVLARDGIGVLGMKPIGDQVILDSGAVTAVECLHYAMNLPTSVVITGCDSMQVLEQALTAARTFRPMNTGQTASLLARTAPYAAQGAYEPYKTTHRHDGTYYNPAWLGNSHEGSRSMR